MHTVERVIIIGLDCAEPSLMFERWLDDLPTLRNLVSRGAWGRLRSCVPPITVPAWSCMAASQDPGSLGIYGFRNRADTSYDGLALAMSTAVRRPRLWELLSDRGRPSLVVGVPGTFPITRDHLGCMVTGILTPDRHAAYTHPPALRDDIAEWVGAYQFDVTGFRTADKTWLLDQIYTMTARRFEVVQHLVRSRPWDLLWLVEMGHDRMHHGFWRYLDPAHHRHEAGHPLATAIHDYCVYADGLIGQLLNALDLSRTAVWIVSDHGAQCMVGGFCLNQWLIERGHLVLKGSVEQVTRLTPDMVDWSRTTAWGEGGYYGRVFINVAGREPHGRVDPFDYDGVCRRLQDELAAVVDHLGAPMGNVAHRPEDLYREVNGMPPDLIAILGELRWRSVGSVGHPTVYTFDNDTGPDDANHAQDGLFVLAAPGIAPGPRTGTTLYDVAPTTLALLGEDIPPGMQGRVIGSGARSTAVSR